MLKGFEPRLYQQTILGTAALKNTLVVLPTGMGKTGIALMLSAQRLRNFPNSKVLFVTPTKPLADQHVKTFQSKLELSESEVVVFTGNVSPQKRAQLWKSSRVIIATPQGVENDVMNESIDFSDVCLLIFDEAHRATGDYSYVFLAKQYLRKAQWPRILALTASPGSESEKIDEVCKNLFIEAVEVRTDDDPDVRPYIQDVDVEWVKVELPADFLEVKKVLELCINERVSELRSLGLRPSGFLNKTALLGMQRELQAKMASGDRDAEIFRGLSVLAEIMKAQHALELVETQGIAPLHKYLEELFASAYSSSVKAVKNLVANVHFKTARVLTQKLFDSGREHPKLGVVVDRIQQELSSDNKTKIILFTQYRDTASKLHDVLSKSGILSNIFVGQAKKSGTGLSQKKQVELIDMFKDGLFNVLIATSVAEEGLDIPKVDVVMFYEPVPSAIRSIQRRGRTGRLEKGKVVMFVAKGTRDEGYSWSSRAKEKKMNFLLQGLKSKLVSEPQQTLQNFSEGFKIFGDYREKGTGVLKELIELGVSVKLDMLKVADYVCSSRVGVELKQVDDFVASIIDGRLLEQLKVLKHNYERPVIIVQGSQDIYSVRQVNANAIRGMLATVAVSYGIPVLSTKDDKDTAALLLAIAKREQDSGKRDFHPHADRKPLSLIEQQEYLVSSLPSVGPSVARLLLKKFGSVQNILNATLEELQEVDGVGPKTAKLIVDVTRAVYEK